MTLGWIIGTRLAGIATNIIMAIIESMYETRCDEEGCGAVMVNLKLLVWEKCE